MKTKIRMLATAIAGALALALGGCGGGGSGSGLPEGWSRLADMEPNEIQVPDDLSMVADSTGTQSLGQLSGCGNDGTQGIVVDGSVVLGADEWDWFEIVLSDDIGQIGILALVDEGGVLYEFDPLDPLSPTAYVFVDGVQASTSGIIGDAQPDVILGPSLPAGTSILIGVRANYTGQVRYELRISESSCFP